MARAPDYGGGSLVNLMAELEVRLNGTPLLPQLHAGLAQNIPEGDTYVLVLFDGLGAAQLAHPDARLGDDAVGRIDARPAVGHAHPTLLDLHLDRFVVRPPLRCVIEQVGDGALDLGGIAAHDGVVHRNLDYPTGAPPVLVGDPIHEVAEGDILDMGVIGRGGGGKVNQLRYEAAQLLDLGFDVSHHLRSLILADALGPAQQFDVGADRSQRSTQFVPGVVDKPALLPA